MTPLQRHLNGFGLSLLAHGSLMGMVLWLWQSQPPKPEPEPIRWEISLFSPAPAPLADATPPPQPEVAPPPPKPAPPKPKAKPKPKPKPKLIERSEPKPVTRYLAAETVEEQAAPPEPPAAAPMPTTVATTGPLTGLASNSQPVQPDPKPDFDWLRRYLADKIRKNKHYPGEARRNGWEGQVLIRAVIGGNGSLLTADIVRSSGHTTLDEEALATLRRVTPVPVSQAHGWTQVAVTIPFDYRLQR
ncbi:energy transducer TonB [Methylocaldum sp.]|uniref:energy transducer TonB n=1 Tax=Methylocaldum sp. TaxID=1969727 RepID=UPI002D316D39|nr:energy transducer TonB [Methylocaldum sp.]HYE33977.1 energy transducer TonB [Methylocaldum sp.]